jgi:16S rRNA (uracil1498-N3)-methyltransferase
MYAGAFMPLNAEQSHYISHVMRRKIGDHVQVFNAEHGEWLAVVAELKKKTVIVQVIQMLRPALRPAGESSSSTPSAELNVSLWFSPLRPHRTEWLVEKATELGVARLCPVITQRTTLRSVNASRLQRIAIEAAEQSERLSVPTLEPLMPLSQRLRQLVPTERATESLRERPREQRLWVADERRSAPSLVHKLSQLTEPWPSLAILIGPEGGLSEDEWIELEGQAESVTLATTILRSETAAIAALAAIAQVGLKS